MKTCLTKLSILTGLSLHSLAIAGPIYSNDFEQAGSDPSAVWSSTLRRDLGGPYSTFLGRFGNTSIDFTLHATASNTHGLPSSSGGGSGGDNPDRPFNLVSKEIRFDRQPIPELDSGGGGGGGKPPSGNIPPANPPHKFDLGGAFNNGGNQPPSTDPLFTVGTYALVFDLMIFDSWDSNYSNNGPDSFSVVINGTKHFDEFFDAHNLNNNFKSPELPVQNAYNPNWQDQIYRDVTILFDVTQATDRFDIAFVGSLTQSLQDESWGLDNVRIESVGQLRGASVPMIPAPGALSLFAAGLGLAARRKRECPSQTA